MWHLKKVFFLKYMNNFYIKKSLLTTHFDKFDKLRVGGVTLENFENMISR